MQTQYGIEYHKGVEPDRQGPTLATGWYVRDTKQPGILNGPHKTRLLARAELAKLRGES